MKDENFYKDTMEQIVISEEAFRAVRNVEVAGRKRGCMLKYVAVAASVVVALFVSSNALTYAMTGSTLVEIIPEADEKISGKVPLKESNIVVSGNVNQSKEEIVSTEEPEIGIPRVVDFYIDENGLHTYVIDLDGQIQTASIRVDGNLDHSSVIVYSSYGRAGIICLEGSLESQDEKIILSCSDQYIDITEDFADGVATGSWYESSGWLKGMTFEYTVTGSMEEYKVDIHLVGAE